jgi:ZIP family zinc transporter
MHFIKDPQHSSLLICLFKMPASTATTAPAWGAEFRNHARQHPFSAFGLLVALLALLALLIQSLWLAAFSENGILLRWALAGGLVAFAATALGALPALALQGVSRLVEDAMLGFAAGMMLAASAFSLILPALDASALLSQSPMGAAGIVVGGMAIGVSFAERDSAVAIPFTTAIAIQDIPEGLAVALAMVAAGFRRSTAVLIAIATGFLEPIGALLGVTLSSGVPLAYPVGLGLAAGAMIFVVSHEVIPETHRNGHQTAATLGLMVGFALMMTLDTALA